MDRENFWESFLNTGSITDYLSYKGITFEAKKAAEGEHKDRSSCCEDQKHRE